MGDEEVEYKVEYLDNAEDAEPEVLLCSGISFLNPLFAVHTTVVDMV